MVIAQQVMNVLLALRHPPRVHLELSATLHALRTVVHVQLVFRATKGRLKVQRLVIRAHTAQWGASCPCCAPKERLVHSGDWSVERTAVHAPEGKPAHKQDYLSQTKSVLQASGVAVGLPQCTGTQQERSMNPVCVHQDHSVPQARVHPHPALQAQRQVSQV